MKLPAWVMVLGACYTNKEAPPPVAANACPALELNCKETVETSRALASKRPRDITIAIGECDQDGWSVAVRKCVASAHTRDDLDQCSLRHKVVHHGVFADRSSTGEAMTAMHGFRDQMCACTDTKCAQLVSDEMTKWGQEQARENRDPPNMSEDEIKAFTQIGEEMGKCMQKAMSAP